MGLHVAKIFMVYVITEFRTGRDFLQSEVSFLKCIICVDSIESNRILSSNEGYGRAHMHTIDYYLLISSYR